MKSTFDLTKFLFSRPSYCEFYDVMFIDELYGLSANDNGCFGDTSWI